MNIKTMPNVAKFQQFAQNLFGDRLRISVTGEGDIKILMPRGEIPALRTDEEKFWELPFRAGFRVVPKGWDHNYDMTSKDSIPALAEKITDARKLGCREFIIPVSHNRANDAAMFLMSEAQKSLPGFTPSLEARR
jgi:hypothetical protein